MSVEVTFVLFPVLFLSISALFPGKPRLASDDDLNVFKYCTVADKVVIKSMQNGDYIVGGNVSDVLSAQYEDRLTGNQFWAIEAGNGFYIIRNLQTSAIMDVKDGCQEGMDNVEVITYQPNVVGPGNRFYISALDNTIGIQCSGGEKLRLMVDETGKLVMADIDDPKYSVEDVHFSIERISS